VNVVKGDAKQVLDGLAGCPQNCNYNGGYALPSSSSNASAAGRMDETLHCASNVSPTFVVVLQPSTECMFVGMDG
jgi:hypothetical protein